MNQKLQKINERGIVELFCKVSMFNSKAPNMILEEDIQVRSFTLPENNREYRVYVNEDIRFTFRNVQSANQSAIELIKKRKDKGWVILSESSNVRKFLSH